MSDTTTPGPYWIQTASGLAFDLESPAGNVSGFDLSHALAGLEVVRLIKTADLELLFWERDRWSMKRPPRPWVGEGTVKQLRAADFGADDEPGFLECWERHVAMTAFYWTCRTLTGHIGSQPSDVDVMRTGWSTVFGGMAREVG